MIKVDEHIVLKPLESSDASDLLHLVNVNRSFFREWMTWVDELKDIHSASAFINHVVHTRQNHTAYTFGVFFDGELIGELGFVHIDSMNRVGQIGYWLSESFQGKGIVNQSISRLILYGWEYLNLNRLEIRIPLENKPSINVAERLGFVKEGVLRSWANFNDTFLDVYLYSKLKTDE